MTIMSSPAADNSPAMANPNCFPFPSHFILSILITLTLIPYAPALNFNLTAFSPNSKDINYTGDAFASQNVIQLTKNQADGSLKISAGRATYQHLVRLWDSATGVTANFTTHFEFIIKTFNNRLYGEGMTFFLSRPVPDLPPNSTEGYLGLLDPATEGNSSNQIVAVEFDTFMNEWDSEWDHVGIDVNSIRSVVTSPWRGTGGLKSRRKGDAWIDYRAGRVSVFLSYDGQKNETSTIYYDMDLKTLLPEWVMVGFSASTGESTEIHNVISWEFNISDLAPPVGKRNGGSIKIGLLVLVVFVGVLGVLGLLCWVLYRKWWREDLCGEDIDVEINECLASGPRRFSYKELCAATKGFSDKLGQGGFGGVYYGLLPGTKYPVAVKRVARGSQQGKKEYISEITVISRLRHRNLVPLLGWCHERGELLLVYEHMSNGSLDRHLFDINYSAMEWGIRFKISFELASALLYLHEESDQRVVHRDVKSSNVMLDANFNAKLGDFGLARLMEHGQVDSATTVIAGTMGYLAPECIMSGKANAVSDVFSFGAVALEIACGKRPVFDEDKQRVRLVDWVWDLYGSGRLLESMDDRLNGFYKEEEAKALLFIGLWCSHPDPDIRPSMGQVIRCLRFEAPLPNLPSTFPKPMFAPLMEIVLCENAFSTNTHHTSATSVGSNSTWTRTTISSSTTSHSDKAFLHNYKSNVF
ncbi:hypothetical protein SUGI_0206980 [Cryptomeria japonica]|uniref:L-type lectin-domain containing receptor kinase IX.1 n=1 Tax=Cryptomeria japonica TaxID=3369 RepID=UPI002408D096|nr:L-type lectin-domain containing receptor kinase IX.1 [Cryptomeria japonica]GLJ13179.1 hypothetical protein SUGI_0206980 [Cryptomeria japonica]